MAFDFDAAMARAKKDATSTALEAIILGPSGAGKSYLAGTFKCKTLYLYSTGETHGVKSAKLAAVGNLIPLCYDYATKADSDASLAALLSILQDEKRIAALGVGAVYVDGATEIEYLIRQSSAWKDACKTAKGGHNTYEEPKATVNAFRPIIVALKDLQRDHDVHIAMSCILDVKEYGASGEIVDCSPRLQGYTVAESLVQQFGDVLVVSKLSKNDSFKHKIQFMTDITKTAKEESGVVKRTVNFSPRIAGVALEKLPPIMDADLSKIVELKQKAFG